MKLSIVLMTLTTNSLVKWMLCLCVFYVRATVIEEAFIQAHVKVGYFLFLNTLRRLIVIRTCKYY